MPCRDLVPFVQFKNEKTLMEECYFLLKVTLLHGCFSRFINCTNGTKSCNASLIISASETDSKKLKVVPVLSAMFKLY